MRPIVVLACFRKTTLFAGFSPQKRVDPSGATKYGIDCVFLTCFDSDQKRVIGSGGLPGTGGSLAYSNMPSLSRSSEANFRCASTRNHTLSSRCPERPYRTAIFSRYSRAARRKIGPGAGGFRMASAKASVSRAVNTNMARFSTVNIRTRQIVSPWLVVPVPACNSVQCTTAGMASLAIPATQNLQVAGLIDPSSVRIPLCSELPSPPVRICPGFEPEVPLPDSKYSVSPWRIRPAVPRSIARNSDRQEHAPERPGIPQEAGSRMRGVQRNTGELDP